MRLRILGLMLLLLVTACGGGVSAEEQAVADAAETWLTAVLFQDGPTIEQYNCNRVDSTPGSNEVISLYAIGLAARNGQFDPAELAPAFTYETTYYDSPVARVRVSGQLPIPPVLRESEVYLTLPPLDILTMDEEWDFVYEGELWRWCGSVLPE